MEEEGRFVAQLREIFDLCDADQDGVITTRDFKKIGQDHFGKTQQIDMLIGEMDPEKSGQITFQMFYQGVENFITESHRQSGSSSRCSTNSCTDNTSSSTGEELSSPGECDSAFSGDDVYPISQRNLSYLTNGYDTIDHSTGPLAVELIADPDNEQDDTLGPPTEQSTPRSSDIITVTPARDSPTLVARQLRRHSRLLLLPPDTPSPSTSTPAEADEEVSRLSDQLHEVTSRLEGLEEDHRDSHGQRQRLKRVNQELRHRLEEYEELMRESEVSVQQQLNDSQGMFHTRLEKVRHESDRQLEDLRSQLHSSSEYVNKLQDVESVLRSQLAFSQQECEGKEIQLGELEEQKRMVEEELRKARQELREEREMWEGERELLRQELHGQDVLVQQLRAECEEVHLAKTENSITASDMGGEIARLKKKLERVTHENTELRAQFLQQGQELLVRSKPQSLAAEMENASKDEVVKALQDTEDSNARLHSYIEGLLAVVIENHPELLEKR